MIVIIDRDISHILMADPASYLLFNFLPSFKTSNPQILQPFPTFDYRSSCFGFDFSFLATSVMLFLAPAPLLEWVRYLQINQMMRMLILPLTGISLINAFCTEIFWNREGQGVQL